MIGFYSLITLIIGFVIGLSADFTDTHPVSKPLSDTIVPDTSKVSSLPPALPSDSSILKEFEKQDIAHPRIVLAQAKLETGHYKSKVCTQNNNLFGLMRGKDYHSFSHWKESIAFYKKHIQSRYKGGDYYAFLTSIGYATDPLYCAKLKKMI